MMSDVINFKYISIMNLFIAAYIMLLFIILTPGVLLTLPKGGSKLVVAAVHGLVFVVLYYLTANVIYEMTNDEDEGFFVRLSSSSAKRINTKNAKAAGKITWKPFR